MPQYDLSGISAISAAAEQARARASQEPNQDSYNAAWLHGYADALEDTARQLEAMRQPRRENLSRENEPRRSEGMVVRAGEPSEKSAGYSATYVVWCSA